MPNRELRYRLKQADRDTFLHQMPVKQRLKFLDKDIILQDDASFAGNQAPHHFLYSQSFNQETLFYLCRLAEAIRVLHKRKGKDGAIWLKGLLPHKKAIGLFNQLSSRTRTSFQVAALNLGMDVLIVDMKTSSEGKGEPWDDTIDTFSVYADALFIRHSDPLRLEEAVWVSNQSEKRIPIINAGSGPDNQPDVYQHPTQMLLDVYTLWRSFEDYGGMRGRKFVFCGDLNARVCRSLIYASRHFPPEKIYLVCPPGRELKPDMINFLKRRNIPYQYCNSLEDIIELVDVVYMIRIQDEYDSSGIIRPLANEYKLKWEYRERLKKSARVLHALPKRNEIDERYDHIEDPHNQFVYKRFEMKNGEWMRSAIFAYLFGVDKKIIEFYEEQYR